MSVGLVSGLHVRWEFIVDSGQEMIGREIRREIVGIPEVLGLCAGEFGKAVDWQN